jgi:spermidine synthase
VGLALGNILFGWLGDRVKKPFRLLVITQACAAVLALLVSQFLGVSQFFFSKLLYILQADFGKTIFVQSIVLFLVLIGPTIFLGATFPLVNRIYARSLPDIGKSIGTAYAVNTVGAILGAFVAGFVFIPLLGKENGLRITTGLQLAVPLLAMAWLMLATGERIRAFTAALITLCLGAGLLAVFPSWNHHILSRGWYHRFETFDRYFDTTSWFDAVWNGASIFAGHVAGYDLVFYGDGIGGFTTVERWTDTIGRVNYTLSNNGKEDASSHGDRLTQALSSHIPLLFHPDPEKVMVLGLASGMTAGEVLHYPVEQLDVLEINDQVVKAAELFNPWNNHCLTDSRARIIVQDGRNHLELTSETYDVIISEPSNPWMAGMANLFTLEHFETVKRSLTEDGIFVQWIHSYAMDWSTFAMVGRTFAEVFPDGILMRTMTSDFLLVGFSGGRNLEMGVAEKNIVYARRSGNITIRNPGVMFSLIVTEDLKRLFGDGPLHTDNRPRLEFAAPKNLGKSDPDIEKRLQEASRLSEQTKKMVASNGNIDASLDILELMTADSSPPFEDIDLDRASEAQKTRYLGILMDYCSGEVVSDYEMFPDDEYKIQCAELQLGDIREYLASGNEDSHAYYRLALALKIMGDTGTAIDALQKSIALDPDDYSTRMELGYILGTEGRLDDAAAQYSEALRINPGSAEAYHNLGVTFFQSGKPSGAIYNYYQALKFDPDSAKAHNNLGIVLAAQGRTDEAINHFDSALQIDTDYVEAQVNLGYQFAKQGRFEEALTHFFEVLEVDPKNAAVETSIGTILSRQGQVSEAITHFDAALGINQNHFPAHYYLGIELLKQGRNEEAAGHLIQAAELNPENPEIFKDLGITMGMMGRFEASAEYFSKALELEPDSAETHDNLGVTLAQMGRLNEAIRHFNKAIEIDSSLEAARSHLATALKQAGMGR